MLQMMRAFVTPPKIDDAEFGLEAMDEVGPGGHFFCTSHTLERYEHAFYQPLVSDVRNFETWQDSGSPTTAQNANRVWKQLLADYEEPPLDPAIGEELDAFVTRRKAEISKGS